MKMQQQSYISWSNLPSHTSANQFLSLLFVLLAFGLLGAGCQEHLKALNEEPPFGTTQPSTGPTTQGTNYTGYFYVLPAAKRDKLAAAVSSLALGADLDDVIHKLGPPTVAGDADCDSLLPRKHRSRVLSYMIAEQSELVVSEGLDQNIDLYFDWHGHLELIDSSYPGVASRHSSDVYDDSLAPDWWIPLPRWLYCW